MEPESMEYSVFRSHNILSIAAIHRTILFIIGLLILFGAGLHADDNQRCHCRNCKNSQNAA